MNYVLGIDIGSTSSELAILTENLKIVYLEKRITGIDMQNTAEYLLADAQKKLSCNRDAFSRVTITGYGRKVVKLKNIEKAEKTEISCYAQGARFFNKNIRTVIDIGGQDSKVISISEQGKLGNFVMNDKCAAGTGRFLEMVAKSFEIELDELSRLSEKSQKKVEMSNICAVFAQSEIVSLVSTGAKIEDITQAIEIAIVNRIYGMAERVGIVDEVMFCGGVAQNHGMVKNLEAKLERPLYLPSCVEFVGAIGAAVTGL